MCVVVVSVCGGATCAVLSQCVTGPLSVCVNDCTFSSLCVCIVECRGESAFSSRMRELDARLMSFQSRHSSLGMPRVHFSNGASSIALLTAAEYYPLLLQTVVVLGIHDDAAIVSHGWKLKIVRCFSKIILLRAQLVAKTHTEASVKALKVLVVQTLTLFKDTFTGYQKSNFKFPKFHLTKHYVLFILEYGSVLSVSTAHSERVHKSTVKPLHKRTSRRKASAAWELMNLIDLSNQLDALVNLCDIRLPSEIRVRQGRLVAAPRDEFTLTGKWRVVASSAWYDILTTVCSLCRYSL